MKKIVILSLFNLLIFINGFSKKDPEAWKKEKNLESQYSFFKNNVSSWDGFLMAKEPQLNEFHKSIMDTVKVLETSITTNIVEISKSKKEVASLTKQLSETKASLESSLKKENELTTLGMPFDKNTFPTILYSIIIIVLLIAIFGYFLFFRSNIVTKESEKRLLVLTEEFQKHKSSASDRETKLRRELQTERNKNHPS